MSKSDNFKDQVCNDKTIGLSREEKVLGTSDRFEEHSARFFSDVERRQRESLAEANRISEKESASQKAIFTLEETKKERPIIMFKRQISEANEEFKRQIFEANEKKDVVSAPKPH